MAKKTRAFYHIFKRRVHNPLRGEEDVVQEIKALVKRAPHKVVLPITEEGIMEAIARNGQADSQNCAGAVCIRKHAKLFGHSVSGVVDWWRNRVKILEGKPKRGTATHICREYAHYDNIEELFDTDKGLKQLLKRVRQAPDGVVYVTLYPITRGRNAKTGKINHPSSNPGFSGKRRPVGAELRYNNYFTARAGA